MTWNEKVAGLFAGGSVLQPSSLYHMLESVGDRLGQVQRAKVRQTIQRLRDAGILRCVSAGAYQIAPSVLGMCSTCGKKPPKEGRRSCSSCLSHHVASFRRRAERARKTGVCINCTAKAIPDQLRCAECAEINRTRCTAWQETQREKKLTSQPGAC